MTTDQTAPIRGEQGEAAGSRRKGATVNEQQPSPPSDADIQTFFAHLHAWAIALPAGEQVVLDALLRRAQSWDAPEVVGYDLFGSALARLDVPIRDLRGAVEQQRQQENERQAAYLYGLRHNPTQLKHHWP